MQNTTANQPGFTIERKLLAVSAVAVMLPMLILGIAIASNSYVYPAMIAAGVTQLIGLIAGYQVVSAMVRQSANLNQTLQNINNGDLEARATAWTNDELGWAASLLNTMCDNSLNLQQSNDERDEVQASIENLISEMKQIAAGDLTIQADVRGDVTGAIAETVNHMNEQLRMIVLQVQNASEEVNGSADQLREASVKMSRDSDAQAIEINQASDQILSMTGSFQQVASLTRESEHVAVEARNATARGLQAVSDTVDGMQRIRDQVQSTSKRIKRLGESSQEIGEIVQMISDIADRTSILALNASIQAAMAGDAGHGFAVVAEEIECLAERSTNATKQISKLIRAIQNETSEVISDMEESTREVVAGSQLAAEAGNMLSEIDDVSSQLVEMIQNSSASALSQAEMASGIASSMSELASSTQESAETNRAASQSFDRLSDQINQLRNSVSQFKISGGITDQYLRRQPKNTAANPSPAVVESSPSDTFVSPLARNRKLDTQPSAGTSQPAGASDARFDMARVSQTPASPTRKTPTQTTHEQASKTHVDILGAAENGRETQNTHQMTVEFGEGSDDHSAREVDDKLLNQVRQATAFLNTDNGRLEENVAESSESATADPPVAEEDATGRAYPPTIMMDDA